MMDKKTILQESSFGESIAELEAEKLKDYFLKTDYWLQVRNGTTDVVYGAKGAGKSAIYMSLVNDEDTLNNQGILISLAENPAGNTVFSSLTNDPPTSHTEFIRLWKLYFLVIAARAIEDFDDDDAKKVREILRDCNLIPAQNKLSSLLKVCVDFVKSFANSKELSTTSEFDAVTGMYSGQKFSIMFGEPNKNDFEKGLVPYEHVFDLLVSSLEKNKKIIWITIDRLDVAFLESEELETNAIKALFKTYLDLAPYSNNLKLKIFLRDDIWNRILNEGFREASHITKYQQIVWSKESLLNLIIRRLLDNEIIVKTFSINTAEVLSSYQQQEKLFYRFFSPQVDIGSRKLTTLEWIFSRTKDGKGINTPREIIQLLSQARTIEIKRLETGINDLPKDILISRFSLKEAAYEVSKQRLEKTLYAEFPILKPYIEQLRGDKAEHSPKTLMAKWSLSLTETMPILRKLIDVGFIEVIGVTPNLRYKIPFLYRPYLDIIQGKAFVEDVNNTQTDEDEEE